jgi:hypothetical protein
MEDFPKLLIVMGLGIALVGVLWLGWTRFSGGAEFPGTFVFQSGGMTCVIPILGSILLSIILTVVLNIIFRSGR